MPSFRALRSRAREVQDMREGRRHAMELTVYNSAHYRVNHSVHYIANYSANNTKRMGGPVIYKTKTSSIAKNLNSK